MKVLGVETSCDETAVALVEDGRKVLSNLISSQAHLHEKFGGVVPEVAARAHLEAINPLMTMALAEAGLWFSDVEGVAVTVGPGLVGALLVGLAAAKAASTRTRWSASRSRSRTWPSWSPAATRCSCTCRSRSSTSCSGRRWTT